MKKIANIVVKKNTNNFSELFNVVNSLDMCIDNLPTLVIGWNFFKSFYPDANILEKKYNGLYWTFSKTERRCDYEEDIVEFYKLAVNEIIRNIQYTYIDIVKFSLTSIKKTIKFLKDKHSKIVFLTKDSQFLFVYSKDYSTVFGISLTLCEYLGIKKKKVLRMLNNATFIKGTSFIDNDLRQIIGNNTHYILPLFDYFSKN